MNCARMIGCGTRLKTRIGISIVLSFLLTGCPAYLAFEAGSAAIQVVGALEKKYGNSSSETGDNSQNETSTQQTAESDRKVCSIATRVENTKFLWDKRGHFASYRAKARERGLTLSDCLQFRADSGQLVMVNSRATLQPTSASPSSPAAAAAKREQQQAEDRRKAEQAERNRLAAAAKREQQQAEDRRIAEQAERNRLAAAAAKRELISNKHAVAVILGNRDYVDPVPDVDYAANDADAMKRFVIEHLGYRDGNIIDLRDASQTELIATFGNKDNHKGKLWQLVRAGKSDVVVFYSGHGVPGLRNRKGYLLPVDANPDAVELNGYPLDDLLDNLAKIKARSMTVYLDACFSGESPKGMLIQAVSGLSVEPRIPDTNSGMTVITAATGDQVASWDKKAKHGLFTKHLLDALAGAADKGDYGNGDGKVTVGELKRYLDDEMTYAAQRNYGRVQTATIKGDADTVLAVIH